MITTLSSSCNGQSTISTEKQFIWDVSKADLQQPRVETKGLFSPIEWPGQQRNQCVDGVGDNSSLTRNFFKINRFPVCRQAQQSQLAILSLKKTHRKNVPRFRVFTRAAAYNEGIIASAATCYCMSRAVRVRGDRRLK